jgi:hypothetical protein
VVEGLAQHGIGVGEVTSILGLGRLRAGVDTGSGSGASSTLVIRAVAREATKKVAQFRNQVTEESMCNSKPERAII